MEKTEKNIYYFSFVMGNSTGPTEFITNTHTHTTLLLSLECITVAIITNVPFFGFKQNPYLLTEMVSVSKQRYKNPSILTKWIAAVLAAQKIAKTLHSQCRNKYEIIFFPPEFPMLMINQSIECEYIVTMVHLVDLIDNFIFTAISKLQRGI